MPPLLPHRTTVNVLALARAGTPKTQIARRLGISRRSVYNILRDLHADDATAPGADPPPRPARPYGGRARYIPTPAQIAAACSEIQARWSPADEDARRTYRPCPIKILPDPRIHGFPIETPSDD